MPARESAVRVEAPARLQLGLIDLRGDLGRIFGGLGVAVEEPSTVIRAATAAELRASGPDADRAVEFARRFLDHHGLEGGARIHVEKAIPAHVGLGSGTQLALAVGRALAELHGMPSDGPSIAAATGRGARSGVGTWTFELGGFVVDAGHKLAGGNGGRGALTRRDVAVRDADTDDGESHGPPPLVARYGVPAAWRCVLVAPETSDGVSGTDERSAFERLPPPRAELVGRITHLLLMGVIPGLLESDITAFGRALTELQRLVGECFAPVQGSIYANAAVADVVERLQLWGAPAVGQSSWGPTAFAFVGGEDEALALSARTRDWMGGRGWVAVTRVADSGARVVRA